MSTESEAQEFVVSLSGDPHQRLGVRLVTELLDDNDALRAERDELQVGLTWALAQIDEAHDNGAFLPNAHGADLARLRALLGSVDGRMDADRYRQELIEAMRNADSNSGQQYEDMLDAALSYRGTEECATVGDPIPMGVCTKCGWSGPLTADGVCPQCPYALIHTRLADLVGE